MITRETIDEVKNRVDIIDVISDFVTLKRSGQNYKALSPFSNEKTASFYVVPAKGIFKDFSSGKGGDAITFVMEHEGMSYLESIRYLAKKYGVEIKEEQRSAEVQAQQSERDGLYIAMNFAKDHFKELLFEHDEGKSIGLSYFRERGFNDRTIQKFELGYALNEWDHLNKTAQEKGYSEDILVKAGLVIKKDDGGRVYDRFRGRVIFPVHNLSGKVIAFGARILTKEKDQPKYINSPETEIYHKSNVLYGMFQAKNAIRREDFCYLVEGYTDVISMHQADVDNAVASSGTALTEEQIKLIRRFTENVTVLFDGDAAGIKAALRGIDLILKGGLNVRIVLLPDSEDPDSYSKKMGSTEFKKYLLDHSKDFISFKIDLLNNESLNDPTKKAEVISDIINSISYIPDSIKRTVYIQEVNRKLDIPSSILNVELNKRLIQDRISKKEAVEKVKKDNTLTVADIHDLSKTFIFDPIPLINLLEQEVIKILINYGFAKLPDEEIVYQVLFDEIADVEFSNANHVLIIDNFRIEIAKGSMINTENIGKYFSPEIVSYLSSFIIEKYEMSIGWVNQSISEGKRYYIDEAVLKAITRLKLRIVQKMMQENLLKLKDVVDINVENTLMEIQSNLDNAKNQLAQALGIVVLTVGNSNS